MWILLIDNRVLAQLYIVTRKAKNKNAILLIIIIIILYHVIDEVIIINSLYAHTATIRTETNLLISHCTSDHHALHSCGPRLIDKMRTNRSLARPTRVTTNKYNNELTTYSATIQSAAISLTHTILSSLLSTDCLLFSHDNWSQIARAGSRLNSRSALCAFIVWFSLYYLIV